MSYIYAYIFNMKEFLLLLMKIALNFRHLMSMDE